MSEFGKNLRRIRTSRGMSQDEFADLLNTSKQVISRYENGQRSPKVKVVGEYAEKLGVGITELTGSPDSPEEDELTDLREIFRRRPEMRTLFSLTRKATPEQVRMFIRMIEAMEERRDE